MFIRLKTYLKTWWKRHVSDMVPKHLDDLF
jgi:hypothetical protein